MGTACLGISDSAALHSILALVSGNRIYLSAILSTNRSNLMLGRSLLHATGFVFCLCACFFNRSLTQSRGIKMQSHSL
jgi:hypothetical protein